MISCYNLQTGLITTDSIEDKHLLAKFFLNNEVKKLGIFCGIDVSYLRKCSIFLRKWVTNEKSLNHMEIMSIKDLACIGYRS